MNCSAASCASSCVATSVCMSPAIMAATSAAAMSSSHRDSYYEEDEDKFYGNIKVNLKGTKTELKEAKNWFTKLFVGDKTWEGETLTQVQYMKKIYDVFNELGYKNALYLDVNEETVYEDDENKDDDLETAFKAAFGKEAEGGCCMALSLDTTGDEEENVLITMDSKHDEGEFPLTIEVKSDDDPKEQLAKIGAKIDEHFECEAIETKNKSEEESEE